MRLGILSDIHANYEALSAVVEAFKQREHRRLLLPGRHGRLRRLAERVLRPRARPGRGHHPRQPRRRRRRRMDYSYYYEAARHALDLHAQLLSTENMQWLKEPPYQLKLDEIERQPLPRLARAARGVRVHLRARASARVPADLRPARPPHADRPLAPVQGVRAHADHGRGASAHRLRARSPIASTS